jgi:uncharacterized protein
MATLSETPPAPASPDADPAPPFPWWSPFLVGIGIYIGLGIVVAVIGIAAGWQAGDIPDRFVLFATLAQDVILIGAAFGVAAATSRIPAWDLGLRRVKPGRGLLWAAVVFVVFFAFLILWQAVLNTDQQDDLAEELGANDSTFNLVVVAVLVGIVAPIAEELFFRGFLFGALRGALGWVMAAIVTGIVFGLIHAGGTDAVFLVPLAVLGFLLCVLYRRTGSLLPGMGVHAFNNALALGAAMKWSGEGTLAACAVAPVVVISIAALFSASRRPDPPAAGTAVPVGTAVPSGSAGAPAGPSASGPTVPDGWLPPGTP